MRSIRLLPLVVFAALALFVLKGIGLLTEGSYVLSGVDAVQAQTWPGVPATLDPIRTGSTTSSTTTPAADAAAPGETAPADETAPTTEAVPAAIPAPTTAASPDANPAQAGSDARTGISDSAATAADRASENLFSRAGPAPINSTQLDAVPFELNKAGEKIPLASGDGGSETEKAVLERLSDRRAELDAFENQLKQREALIAAAEKRIDERVNELKALEARINALVEQKKATDDEQFKGLVSMYETMKPKDAATIFDQLSGDVLFRVASAMNPRKMAPVLAAMSPDRAQELTTLLAAKQTEPSLDPNALQDLASLPQIVGQ